MNPMCELGCMFDCVEWGGPSPQDEPSKMKTFRVRMYIPVQKDCPRALRSGNVAWYLEGTPSITYVKTLHCMLGGCIQKGGILLSYAL